MLNKDFWTHLSFFFKVILIGFLKNVDMGEVYLPLRGHDLYSSSLDLIGC